MTETIRETPPVLVEAGRIQTGFFKTPFRRANLLDADNMGGRRGRMLRWLRLKEWVGYGVNHEKLFGGIIIQNAKYAASGTVYLYDRETRRKQEWLIVDWPLRARLPETLWNSESRCGGGRRFLRFEHDLERNRHRIRSEVKAGRKNPALFIDLVCHQDWRRVDPLVVSLPIAPDHHTYTHKSPLRLEGVVRIGGLEYVFDPERDLGNLDEQKTFYPYRSKWKWGCFTVLTKDGREIMLNVVDQMTHEGEPGEDALWVDGKMELLAPPVIAALSGRGDYRIETPDGRVNVRFAAEGSKAEKRNFQLIRMDYEQYFGRYDGEIVDGQGNRHIIEGAFGALERMDARF